MNLFPRRPRRPRASRSVPHSLRLSLSIRPRVPRHRHAPPLDPAPPASTPSFSAPALRPRLSKSPARPLIRHSEESASASMDCPGSRDDGPRPVPRPDLPLGRGKTAAVPPREAGGSTPSSTGVSPTAPPRTAQDGCLARGGARVRLHVRARGLHVDLSSLNTDTLSSETVHLIRLKRGGVPRRAPSRACLASVRVGWC